MAFCSNCGKKIEADAKFCAGCGAPVSNAENPQIEKVIEGNIHICPNCGKSVNSFVVICPSCGFEFRDAKASSVVKEFADELDKLSAQKEAPSALSGITKWLGIGKADNTEDQILNKIRSFAVPNTKEDVIEFMILASSNINMSAISAYLLSDAGANNIVELNAMKARNDAWLSKMEQVYQKANIAFRSDSDFVKIQKIYDRTMKAISDAQKERKAKIWKIQYAPMCMLFAIIALAIIPLVLFGLSHSNKEKKLEETVQEIQVDISNGDYDAALIKAHSLYMDDSGSSESKKHWDEQRESLIQTIKQLKEENKK